MGLPSTIEFHMQASSARAWRQARPKANRVESSAAVPSSHWTPLHAERLIKAAEPNTRVRLRLFEWADRGGDFPENRHECEATITATTDWARYQLSGILLPNLHEGYVARIVPSSRIWLDDVQVEEGNQDDYQAAQAIEVGAETPTRWCHVGESVEVTARERPACHSTPSFSVTPSRICGRAR